MYNHTDNQLTMAATSCTSKDLTCTVCLDHFKEPKVLLCCHTFCKGCLERILEKSKDKAKLVCPKCRTEHKVPENGPEEFLTDFTITHELESLQLRESKQQPTPATCEQCDSTDPAVAYCTDCPALLCDFCSQAHKRMKLCQNHTVVGLHSGPLKCVPKAPAPYCSKHPDEGLKLFCKTCQCLVCCTCIVATHQGHKLGLVDSETRKEMETQLKSLVDEAQQQLDQFEENLQYIVQVEKQAMNRPIELKSVINTTFDSLVATLESRRAELLKEVDNTCNTDLKEVWAQKEYNETTLLSLRSATSFAKRSLQCSASNDLELITLTAQIIARLKCLQDVEWDPGTTEAVERTNLKLTQQHPKSDLKLVGKIVKNVSQSPAPQFIMEAIPENVRLGIKVTFRVRVQAIRKARKQTTDLDIKVLYGHSQTGVLIPQTTHKKDGSLTATFTPVCSGQHVIQLGVQSEKINVKGIPIIGVKIRRGPDWSYSNEDIRSGVPGVVCQHKNSVSKIDVQWKNGTTLDYRWGADDKYEVELAI